MITAKDSIPGKNHNYKLAEDIFFFQFNDISFYIEDEDQENFFFCILRKIFPEIKIEKIFPLSGKESVIDESTNCIGDKKKVFIVDKDFDDLLDKIVENDNLFYLDRYSIENYLLEEKAIVEYVIGEKPRMSKKDVVNDFSLDEYLNKINPTIGHLVHLHIIVQMKCPSLQNVSRGYERFIIFNDGEFVINQAQIIKYESDIQEKLRQLDGRLTLNGQLNKLKEKIFIRTNQLLIKHVPGKYIIKMVKQLLETQFSLPSRNIDSFSYRSAEKSNFESLQILRNQVHQYLE